MKTLSTAVLVAAGSLAACSRDEPKPGAAQHAAAPAADARPEVVPVGKRRVVELEGGIRVEVLAEGQGEVVAPGDHVALSMTLSYVPVAAPVATEPASGGETGEKGDGSKEAPVAAEKAKVAEPVDVEGVVVLDGVAAAAKTEPAPVDAPAADDPSVPASAEPDVPASAEVDAPAGTEPVASVGTEPVAPVGTEPVAPESGEPAAATAATAPTPDSPAPPPEPALAAPLEPVVLMSTKSAGTPLRVVVGNSGALLPGLSRALVGLRQGTIVEITLPPEAAYGAAGLPAAGVPPGTPLFATVEIREVRR